MNRQIMFAQVVAGWSLDRINKIYKIKKGRCEIG